MRTVASDVVMAGVAAFTAKMGASVENTWPGLTTWIGFVPTLAIAAAGTLT